MSGLEFTASLVQALAWPLGTVVLALVLRTRIDGLLAGPGRGLRRLRAGPVEVEWAEWAEASDRTGTQVSRAIASVDPRLSGAASLVRRLGDLARSDPLAAILHASQTLEGVLADLLRESGVTLPRPLGGPRSLARLARDRGLLSEPVVKAVDGVYELREMAVRQPERVTRQQALQFLAFVDAALYAISAESVAG